MPRLYLAGPDVFLANAAEIGERKKALCQAYGFEGLFPLDHVFAKAPGSRADHLIYAANIAMIENADLGIFNLTPFRGPSSDVGTVFELGMMAAQNKPVFGYTNASPDMRDRIRGVTFSEDGVFRDKDGFIVEDFGNADNLMIDSCLARPGNAFFRIDAAGRLDDLRGFKKCLQMAAGSMPAYRTARAIG